MEINNQFIKQHDRLVRVIVNQFKVANVDPEDLMQEGRIGLIEAAKRFDPARGIQFSSYASWWIRKYIYEAILSYGHIIKIQQHLDNPYECRTEPLDKILYIENKEAITYAEILTDGETIETQIIEKEKQMCVEHSLSRLSSREREVVEAIYGLESQPLTTEELAKKMGTSPNRIRRVHERAIHKVRHFITH